jgi:TatD DNase family protein
MPAMRLVDSHCHLQADRFADDVEAVLTAAQATGVERILVPGWDLGSSRAAVELVERFPWLDAAVGVHPHEAAKASDADWRVLVALASDRRVVAIGETGLDLDRRFSPLRDQVANLRRNLALALETGKPAILHVRSPAGGREAQDLILDELRTAGLGGPAWAAAFGDRPQAVIHSFSGPVDYARAVLDMNLAISISGLAFRAGEEATAGVAAIVPPERLLVETDSPFLQPPGAPKRRNEPAWVRVTAAWVAEHRVASSSTFGATLVEAYDVAFPRVGGALRG